MNTIKFKVGQKLKARSICDSNSFFEAEVLKRTDKTVTIKFQNKEKRCKVHVHENINEGNEFIFPAGRYSMCPVFQAS